MKSYKKLYEYFQVDDLLNFSFGQLALAHAPDGTQVLLHELDNSRSLPIYYKESLLNLKHPNLTPILEVYEDDQSTVIVHSVLSGDPLSLLVKPDQPMEFRQALHLYRLLLKSVQELLQNPIPIFTTLDPRNIVLNGSHPYLLFFDFRQLDKQEQQDNCWRTLLYFLVTGRTLQHFSPTGLQLSSRIPKRIQHLIRESLNPSRSLEEIVHLLGKEVSNS